MKKKELKYQKISHEIWRWILKNEKEVFAEWIQAFGNQKLLDELKQKLPPQIEIYLEKYQSLKKSSNFEMGKIKLLVEEFVKDYTFIFRCASKRIMSYLEETPHIICMVASKFSNSI